MNDDGCFGIQDIKDTAAVPTCPLPVVPSDIVLDSVLSGAI